MKLRLNGNNTIVGRCFEIMTFDRAKQRRQYLIFYHFIGQNVFEDDTGTMNEYQGFDFIEFSIGTYFSKQKAKGRDI